MLHVQRVCGEEMSEGTRMYRGLEQEPVLWSLLNVGALRALIDGKECVLI